MNRGRRHGIKGIRKEHELSGHGTEQDPGDIEDAVGTQ